MEASFWIKSWELGGFYTSFHRKDIHPYVLEYLQPEEIEGKNILIPLCGKSVDMLYLAQYAQKVIGVELVEDAIIQFFEENNLSFQKLDDTTYQSGNITLMCCDFMALTNDEVGKIDWIYDRASLVALPDDGLRQEYIKTIDRLSDIGTKSLIITLEYFPLINSAPFTITPEEVDNYYGNNHIIKHVENPNLPNHGMVKKWNLEYLIEHGFITTKYSDKAFQTVEKSEKQYC